MLNDLNENIEKNKNIYAPISLLLWFIGIILFSCVAACIGLNSNFALLFLFLALLFIIPGAYLFTYAR